LEKFIQNLLTAAGDTAEGKSVSGYILWQTPICMNENEI